jgi:hypothetical protein
MTRLSRVLPLLVGLAAGLGAMPPSSQAMAQGVSAEQHAAEIMKAYACNDDAGYRIAVLGPDTIQARLRRLACPLVKQALHMVASGRASQFGVSPSDTSRLRFAQVVEFRFLGYDKSGNRIPADDEAYWAIALLFSDPARTIEHDVYMGSRKTLLRRTEPMDTTLLRRPPN